MSDHASKLAEATLSKLFVKSNDPLKGSKCAEVQS